MEAFGNWLTQDGAGFNALVAMIAAIAGMLGINVVSGGELAYRLFHARRAKRLLGEVQRPDWVNRRKVLGRDGDVAALRAMFLRRERSAVVVTPTITGGAGIGKTTLARHYRACHADLYDRTDFVRAETEASLMADLAGIADRIRGPEPVPVKARAEQALEIIRTETQTKSWLVVFDNVLVPTDITPWLPEGRKLHVIITTRHPDWRGEVFETHRAGVLAPETSVALLAQEAGRDDPGFGDLAETLGHLPLALVQVGEWLRQDRRRTATDASRAIDRVLRDRVPPAPGEDRDYAESSEGAIRLMLEGLSPDARRLLGILIWFDPDRIEPFAIEQLANVPWQKRWFNHFKLPRTIWALGRHRDRLNEAFAELRLSALLEDAEEAGLYRLHRVTARVARQHLGRVARPKRAAALLAAVYPVDALSSANWSECRRLTPHVRAMGAAGAAPETAAMDFCLNQASLYLAQIGDVAGQVETAQAALTISEARLPEGHRDVVVGYTNLSAALQEAGDLDAAEAAARRAVALETEHRPGGLDLALHENQLANVLEVKGDLTGALRAYQRAALHQRWNGPRLSDEYAVRLNNLGFVRRALGQGAAALRLLEASLTIRRQVLAPGDARLGFALNNVGSTALEAGRADRAEDLLREGLALRIAAYAEDAPDHPYIANSAQWLVSALLVRARAGEAAEAKTAEARALCETYGFDWAERQQRAALFPYTPGG